MQRHLPFSICLIDVIGKSIAQIAKHERGGVLSEMVQYVIAALVVNLRIWKKEINNNNKNAWKKQHNLTLITLKE